MSRLHKSNKVRAALGVTWVVLAAVVATYMVNDRRSELSGISAIFSHLQMSFLVPALILECASMAAYAQLQRSMLAAGRVNSGFWRMVAIFLASNSISSTIPGGTAFATVYSYRRFRDIGASEGLSGWAVLAVNVLAALSLFLLALAGLLISEGGVSGISLTGSLVSVGIMLALVLYIVTRADGIARKLGRTMVYLEQRLGVSWRATRKVRQLEEEIRTISPSSSRLARAFLWGLMNWLFDACVLIMAYLATGSPIPFDGLLLAYSAGQLAANLPITPGGLGVVEGSISIALVAYGGNQEASIAAVLLYRLLSFWVWLLPGAGCYFGLRIKGRSARSMNTNLHASEGVSDGTAGA